MEKYTSTITSKLTQQVNYILGESKEPVSLQVEQVSPNSELYQNESPDLLMFAIPENLDLAAFLREHPPTFKYKESHFLYIIHLITEIPSMDKDLLKKGDFTPIKAATLHRKVRPYQSYLKYLVENGILETDNHFILGEKCRGYRFSGAFRTRIRFVAVEDAKLKKAIHSWKVPDYTTRKKYDHLYMWFNEKLNFDYPGAVEYLNKTYSADTRAFNVHYLNITKFHKRDFYFHVDENIHRLHTNFTNLKKEFRHFISYDGYRLVNVDFKNSQPFLANVLFRKEFYEKSNNKNYQINIFNTLPNKTYNNINYQSIYITLTKQVESQYHQGYSTYQNLTENGIFYEYLAEKFKTGSGSNYTREKVKDVTLKVLYSRNSTMTSPAGKDIIMFSKVFPEQHEIFRTIKEKDHRLLPIMLQRIESKLVLEYITKRIHSEFPKLPLFTIHDSIVCPAGYEEIVRNIAASVIEEKLDLQAKLECEYWNPNRLSA